MAQPKYFDAIEEAQRTSQANPSEDWLPFDLSDLEPKGWLARKKKKAKGRATARIMPLLLWLFRRVGVCRFLGFYWVARHEDVTEALRNDALLGVPFGPEMRELSRGADAHEADFVLGLDGPEHSRQREIIRRIIPYADSDVLETDLGRVREWTSEFAEALIEGGGGRLDVACDFATRIPTEICRKYFGLRVTDPKAFADWSIAVSAILFADPYGDPTKRRLGLAAAARLCQVIDLAIERAKRPRPPKAFIDLTLVERLVDLQRDDLQLAAPVLNLADSEIRAIVLGLVAGFIPTNGLAGAKIIESLMLRGRGYAAAVAAAEAGDREAMERAVLEAGRLNPALAPGQWRYAWKDTSVGGRKIRAGATVLVSTMSAMRDSRAGKDAELMFGYGSHHCLGKRLALAVITEMLLVLFGQPRLRLASDRTGVMEWLDFFPRRLDVKYESFTGVQSMIVACIPVEVERKTIEAKVAALGNPANDHNTQTPNIPVRATLDASGIVHFASCAVINAGPDDAGPLFLVMELNLDGDRDRAIDRFAEHAAPWLRPLLEVARPGDERNPAQIIREHAIDLHFRPGGTVGLNFYGTGDFPVAMIEKQARLRRLVEEELARFLDHAVPDGGLGNRAMSVLAAVRRAIRENPAHRDLAAFLVQPSRKMLPIAEWREPEYFLAPLKKVLWTRLGLKLGAILLTTVLFFSLVADYALRGSGDFSFGAFMRHISETVMVILSPQWDTLTSLVPYAAVVLLLSFLLTLFFWGLVAGAVYAIFRVVESREKADDQAPSLETMRELVASENPPGCRQNHITAVTPLKRGIVRRLALSVALWGIRQSLHWFRPGYVSKMGTIHYAKWFVLPRSRKLIFQANYDGSWESYLEDFIVRAHPGQTAAWSNGEGFPKSRGLIGQGAKDGDRFKRWVRRQQVRTPFWYSRFKDLTTADIRTNALVHDGLARAATDTDARTWLDLLGSAPRQNYEIESTEIQSLLFRGLKRATFTACLPVKLPEEKRQRGNWLWAMLKQVSFGTFPEEYRAFYLGLSPSGFRKLGQGAPLGARDLLRFFPAPFAMGMANRNAILGDVPPNDAEEPWRWTDAEFGAEAGDRLVADAVLIIYAPDRAKLEESIAAHRSLLEKAGGSIVQDQIIRTVPIGADGNIQENGTELFTYEHFGFRDGLSTPVIRGTEKDSPPSPDVVKPGEFIIGYRNNQDYFVPGIMVPAGSDVGDELPVAADDTPFGYARFGGGGDGQIAPRDLGRNGSFLVIRELSQDRNGFLEFVERKAQELTNLYGAEELRQTVGTPVSGQWLAAKLMGRWQDGRSLVGNPAPETKHNRPEPIPDNDFHYGRDDPRGQACPLGAHARRANARDSLKPDDPLEPEVTRRHLLIRRGRTYFRNPSGKYVNDRPEPDAERGLLFMVLCADLERQFEFVQQTWLNSPGFHGLHDEPDPIATRHGLEGARKFTIPTSSGPLIVNGMESFVRHHGGGYFFLPSRSAIRYLAHLGQPDPVNVFL